MATMTVVKEVSDGTCTKDNGEGYLSLYAHPKGTVPSWVAAFLATVVVMLLAVIFVIIMRARARARAKC